MHEARPQTVPAAQPRGSRPRMMPLQTAAQRRLANPCTPAHRLIPTVGTDTRSPHATSCSRRRTGQRAVGRTELQSNHAKALILRPAQVNPSEHDARQRPHGPAIEGSADQRNVAAPLNAAASQWSIPLARRSPLGVKSSPHSSKIYSAKNNIY